MIYGESPPLLCNMPLPLIPISAFNKAGMFERSDDASAPGARQFYALKVPGLVCSGFYVHDEQSIILDCTVERIKTVLSIQVSYKYGRPFFVCDCCGKYRNHIVIDYGQPVCVEEYREERGPVRGRPVRCARVVIALEDLRRLRPIAAFWDPGREGFRVRRKRRSVTPLPTPKTKDRLSTEQALLLGRGAADFDFTAMVENERGSFWAQVDTAKGFRRPDNVALISDHPVLDIRVLAPALLREGSLRAQTLCWGERSEPHVEILFVADWRDAEPHLVAVWDYGNIEAPRMQNIRILLQSTKRLRFICPVEGKNYDVLYLRDGLFASRIAQRLVHPSQRAAGRTKNRSSRKAGK